VKFKPKRRGLAERLKKRKGGFEEEKKLKKSLSYGSFSAAREGNAKEDRGGDQEKEDRIWT